MKTHWFTLIRPAIRAGYFLVGWHRGVPLDCHDFKLSHEPGNLWIVDRSSANVTLFSGIKRSFCLNHLVVFCCWMDGGVYIYSIYCLPLVWVSIFTAPSSPPRSVFGGEVAHMPDCRIQVYTYIYYKIYL